MRVRNIRGIHSLPETIRTLLLIYWRGPTVFYGLTTYCHYDDSEVGNFLQVRDALYTPYTTY